ncbi:MAG TPA: WD40 repeat domain-containing serine/threonine protein kinase, partial [Gemmataceae bacterium]|nr:WD40 repeat domain-containing serine/threonine protein kinase [Gemmataceae bacterium]
MNPQIEETASKLARLPPNPSPPVGPDLSLRQLLVTLRMDQEACWQQGQRISAEEYLQAHPTLQTDRELAVELIYAEFLLREQRGESPDIEEYRRRFPQYAERLQLQIELHRAIQAQTATRGEDGSLGFLPFSPSPPPGYEIVEELGRGAMGLVYRAYQVRLKRWVALKVLRADGQEDAGQLARFRTEAEAAAQLRHPHIVQIHEIGDHDGRPYLAMEYVEGGNLARFLNGAPQPARFCAALLEKLARALQVAHDHGIIHRDLKPGNVLLQESETRNPKSEEESQMRDPKSEKDQTTPRSDFGFRIPDFEPKIADFGLAKFADASSTWAGGGATQTGMIMGTPSYMAPEQASGTNRQIGAGTDVYALGAVLYEMLTGRPPFRGESMWDTLQQVQFQEPVSPSRLQPKVPRDLETICLKCLQKKPFNRYGSALALAEDLARFLHDRPILARRSSASERAWRWCRRNPVVASLTGSVLLLLVILLGMSLVDNARLGEQLGKVERAEKEKTDKLWDSYFASARASRWSGRPGRRFDGLEAIRQAAAIRTNLRLRNEGIALLTLSDVRIAGELPNGFPPGTAAVTLDPDFVHYARSDSKGNISVRTVAEDREVGLLSGFGTHAWLMGFSPNGRFLSALYHDPGRERIWDWRRSRVVLEGDITGGIDFRPNSAQASVGQKDGHIAIWDLDSEKIVQRLQVGAPKDGGSSGYFDPSGNLLAVCEDRPEVKIFELATGKLIRQLNVAEIGAIAWEPSGTQLAHISPTRITVWNARTWTQQTVLNTPDSHTTHAAFGAGGRVLASAGWDGILRLWDPAAGRELLALHGALVPRFSRDGARLGPTLEGTAIHTWEVTTSGQYRVLHPPLGPSHPTLGAEFSPDGTLLAQ